MKKTLGIILIIVGFCLALVIKIGPSKETGWLFSFGIWPPLIVAIVCLIPGYILYNKNR